MKTVETLVEAFAAALGFALTVQMEVIKWTFVALLFAGLLYLPAAFVIPAMQGWGLLPAPDSATMLFTGRAIEVSLTLAGGICGLAIVSALLTALIGSIVSWAWRRFGPPRPTFHERYMETLWRAQRKVWDDQLQEMRESGAPMWEPDKDKIKD